MPVWKLSRAGKPHPAEWRLHRSFGGDQDVGAFADGAAFLLANGAFSVTIPVAGAARWRHRAKLATGQGTFSYAYVRPDGTTAYGANNPANLALNAAGTAEGATVESAHYGEALVKITFTPAADGSFAFNDFSQT